MSICTSLSPTAIATSTTRITGIRTRQTGAARNRIPTSTGTSHCCTATRIFRIFITDIGTVERRYTPGAGGAMPPSDNND